MKRLVRNETTEAGRAAWAAVDMVARRSYHWRDGWYFSRTPDGSVEIMRALTQEDRRTKGPEARAWVRICIPAAEWDSIIAALPTDSGDAA